MIFSVFLKENNFHTEGKSLRYFELNYLKNINVSCIFLRMRLGCAAF